MGLHGARNHPLLLPMYRQGAAGERGDPDCSDQGRFRWYRGNVVCPRSTPVVAHVTRSDQTVESRHEYRSVERWRPHDRSQSVVDATGDDYGCGSRRWPVLIQTMQPAESAVAVKLAPSGRRNQE